MIVTRRRKREIDGERNIVKATKWRREENKIITKENKKKDKKMVESKVMQGKLVYDHKVQVLGFFFFFYHFWKFKVKMTMKIHHMTSKNCVTRQK
jgi:hypothetical protein